MYKQISIYPRKFIGCSIKLNVRGEQRVVEGDGQFVMGAD